MQYISMGDSNAVYLWPMTIFVLGFAFKSKFACFNDKCQLKIKIIDSNIKMSNVNSKLRL